MAESEEKIEKIEFIISLCFRTIKNIDGEIRVGQVVTAQRITFENINKSDLITLFNEAIGDFMTKKNEEINKYFRESSDLIQKKSYALLQSHSVVKL